MPFGGQLLSNDNAYVIPVLVLSYSAGAWLDARRSVVALGLGLALLWAWALLPGPDGSTNGVGQTALAFFYVTVLLVPTWLVGRFVRRHGVRAGAFRELAAQAAAEQERPRRGGDRRRARADRLRASGHHRPQHQRDGDPGW